VYDYSDLQTANDKWLLNFIRVVRLWKQELCTGYYPSLYNAVPKGLKKLVVLDKTEVTPTDLTLL
jgi:hypothetical protein